MPSRNRGEVLSIAPVGAGPNRTSEPEAPEGLASDNFVSLPAWFPADKAAAVLKSKGKRFALVTDRGGASLVADLKQMIVAPATKTVAWSAARLGPAVAPTESHARVRAVMDAHGSAYLPVMVGAVIVGIVSRDAIGIPVDAQPRSLGRVAA